jgi:hypothetical protein
MSTTDATRHSDAGGVEARYRSGSRLLAGFVAVEIVAILVASLMVEFDPFWTPVQVWLVSTYGLGGAFLVRRQPGNNVGVLLWAIGAIYGLTIINDGMLSIVASTFRPHSEAVWLRGRR